MMEFWLILKALLSLALVLGLMLLTLWAIKYCQLHAAKSSWLRKVKHNPRLDVVEKRRIDARTSLVLIKRDNVEHLIVLGAGQPMVVEANIIKGKNK